MQHIITQHDFLCGNFVRYSFIHIKKHIMFNTGAVGDFTWFTIILFLIYFRTPEVKLRSISIESSIIRSMNSLNQVFAYIYSLILTKKITDRRSVKHCRQFKFYSDSLVSFDKIFLFYLVEFRPLFETCFEIKLR